MWEGSEVPDTGEFAGGGESRELVLLGGHQSSLVTSENVSRGEHWTCFRGTESKRAACFSGDKALSGVSVRRSELGPRPT